MGQQIIVYVLVAGAAVYVVKSLTASIMAIFEKKSGCGSGCGNCAFAAKPQAMGAKPGGRVSNVIPLTDIRSVAPQKRD